MPRILIVDDDLIYLDELARGLQAFGHTVHIAVTISEAIRVLENNACDAAICDTIMAGGGALSFLHEVRVKWPDFPVVVITGRKEIATSPLFKAGMREADAKIEKTKSVSEIERLVVSLLD